MPVLLDDSPRLIRGYMDHYKQRRVMAMAVGRQQKINSERDWGA
jgi:hypothetical protein